MGNSNFRNFLKFWLWLGKVVFRLIRFSWIGKVQEEDEFSLPAGTKIRPDHFRSFSPKPQVANC